MADIQIPVTTADNIPDPEDGFYNLFIDISKGNVNALASKPPVKKPVPDPPPPPVQPVYWVFVFPT